MNRKGISTVVATILIVLLAVVAVVIIWAVLKPALERTASKVSTECIEVDIEVSSATCDSVTDTADVIVRLNAGTVSGVKLIFSNGTDSAVSDQTAVPVELGTKSYNGISTGVEDASSVNVAGVVMSETGETRTCTPTATPYSC
jgi:hypothetical protein